MRGRLTCHERRTSRRASEPSKRLKLCATSSDVDSRLVGARHERKDARNVGSRIQSACQAPEIRWAVIALQQQERAFFGGETSLELVLSGYLTAEMESNMLALMSAMESGAKVGPI